MRFFLAKVCGDVLDVLGEVAGLLLAGWFWVGVLGRASRMENGTHRELVDRAGLYSELWSAQETMFVEEPKDGEGKVVEVEGNDIQK